MTEIIRPFSTSVVRIILEEENYEAEEDNEEIKSFSRMKNIPKEIDETLANVKKNLITLYQQIQFFSRRSLKCFYRNLFRKIL